MSSTNRGAVRDLDDHYATPPLLARLVCETLNEYGYVRDPVNILEPGCGEGSFIQAFRDVWPQAVPVGVDLNPNLIDIARERNPGGEYHVDDFLRMDSLPHFSAIIGNPPFKDAEAFIEKSLDLLDPDYGTLAFLLRANFVGGKGRFQRFWSKHYENLKAALALPMRPGFTADGKSDSIEYAIYVWAPWMEGDCKFGFIDNTRIENKWKGEQWHWRRDRPVATGASE